MKEEIFSRLPVTITLAVGAAVIWVLIGIPIGIISAVKRGSVWDRGSMVFALIGVSAPVFWLAYLFLYIFWFKFGWAPPSGIPIGESVLEAVFSGVFILPWIVLSLTFAAFYARMVRGNLIETMGEDYIRTARAKGLSEKRVIYKHGLRAALTPVVTMFGLDLADAARRRVHHRDGLQPAGHRPVRGAGASSRTTSPSVMGVTLFAAFFIAIANLCVDIAYAFLDPRVRYT